MSLDCRIVMIILPQLQGLGRPQCKYIPSECEFLGAWEKKTALKQFKWHVFLGTRRG